MSAEKTPAGATPGSAPDWHSIDWKKVYRTVRRLQARIVKAVREGRWGKVKALVYLLTHSFAGRALAILRVVTNSGARTPGVDGVLWNSPELKSAAFNTPASARLPAATVTPGVHSETKREIETLRDSHPGRQSPASTSLAGSGPHWGNPGGPALLWLPPRTQLCGCHRAFSLPLVSFSRGKVDPRRRHKILFRSDQP